MLAGRIPPLPRSTVCGCQREAESVSRLRVFKAARRAPVFVSAPRRGGSALTPSFSSRELSSQEGRKKGETSQKQVRRAGREVTNGEEQIYRLRPEETAKQICLIFYISAEGTNVCVFHTETVIKHTTILPKAALAHVCSDWSALDTASRSEARGEGVGGACVREGRRQRRATSYLPLLEGVSGQVASAGRLEERDVPPGLEVALLLQPGQSSRSEEDLRKDRTSPSASAGEAQMHAAAKYLSLRTKKTRF